MKKRTLQYIAMQKAVKLAKRLTGCIEFPHFGAIYPDATCIDGRLWDLDSGDTPGQLTSGGDDPCPCCRTREYVGYMYDCEAPYWKVIPHLKFLFNKYGAFQPEQSK